VLIYVGTSKPVGDPDHIKVFANADATETWLRKTIRKAWRSNMRFWDEPIGLRALRAARPINGG